jgi:hypothetical protein
VPRVAFFDLKDFFTTVTILNCTLVLSPKQWLVPKQNMDSYKRFKFHILHHSHLVLDFLNLGVLLGSIVNDVASLVGGVSIGDS